MIVFTLIGHTQIFMTDTMFQFDNPCATTWVNMRGYFKTRLQRSKLVYNSVDCITMSHDVFVKVFSISNAQLHQTSTDCLFGSCKRKNVTGYSSYITFRNVNNVLWLTIEVFHYYWWTPQMFFRGILLSKTTFHILCYSMCLKLD